MAQDIKKLLERDKTLAKGTLPQGHEARFLDKLDKALPESKQKTTFPFMKLAAGFVLFFGLGYAGYWFVNQGAQPDSPPIASNQVVEETKSLGDVSPELKKVEDYYMASINLELSKVKYTEATKEVFDGYLERMDELTQEYKRLTKELNDNGPNELLINALIDNLKFRLSLLYKLRSHLNELQKAESNKETQNQIS